MSSPVAERVPILSMKWLSSPLRVPALVYAWAQLVLLVWWAGNFPAQMTLDSTAYLRHVTVGPWTADHSVLYDAIIKLSLFLTGNVWLVTLAQTVVYAAALALIVSRIHALGVRFRWAALPAVLIVFLPTFGSFVDMLWKDVPFAAANLLLAATLLKIIAQRRAGARAMTWPTAITLCAELTAITLFRNNGFIVVVLVAVALLIALAGSRTKLAAAVVAALVIFELAGSVVYPAAGIKPVSSSESYGVFYGDIANVYYRDPSAFSSADLAVMKKAEPLADWHRSGTNCLTTDPVFHSINRAEANAHRYQLAEIWFRLLARAPVTLIRVHLCHAKVAWWVPMTPKFALMPRSTPHNLYANVNPMGYGNRPRLTAALRHQLAPNPLSWKLYHAAKAARVQLHSSQLLQLLIARAAGWSYLAYLVLIVAAFRNKWRMILLAATPILANQLTVMIANPAQYYRYTVAQLFLSMLLVPLVAAKWPSTRKSSPQPQQVARYDSLEV